MSPGCLGISDGIVKELGGSGRRERGKKLIIGNDVLEILEKSVEKGGRGKGKMGLS